METLTEDKAFVEIFHSLGGSSKHDLLAQLDADGDGQVSLRCKQHDENFHHISASHAARLECY